MCSGKIGVGPDEGGGNGCNGVAGGHRRGRMSVSITLAAGPTAVSCLHPKLSRVNLVLVSRGYSLGETTYGEGRPYDHLATSGALNIST